jgi:hypothetical protein
MSIILEERQTCVLERNNIAHIDSESSTLVDLLREVCHNLTVFSLFKAMVEHVLDADCQADNYDELNEAVAEDGTVASLVTRAAHWQRRKPGNDDFEDIEPTIDVLQLTANDFCGAWRLVLDSRDRNLMIALMHTASNYHVQPMAGETVVVFEVDTRIRNAQTLFRFKGAQTRAPTLSQTLQLCQEKLPFGAISDSTILTQLLHSSNIEVIHWLPPLLPDKHWERMGRFVAVLRSESLPRMFTKAVGFGERDRPLNSSIVDGLTKELRLLVIDRAAEAMAGTLNDASPHSMVREVVNRLLSEAALDEIWLEFTRRAPIQPSQRIGLDRDTMRTVCQETADELIVWIGEQFFGRYDINARVVHDLNEPLYNGTYTVSVRLPRHVRVLVPADSNADLRFVGAAASTASSEKHTSQATLYRNAALGRNVFGDTETRLMGTVYARVWDTSIKAANRSRTYFNFQRISPSSDILNAETMCEMRTPLSPGNVRFRLGRTFRRGATASSITVSSSGRFLPGGVESMPWGDYCARFSDEEYSTVRYTVSPKQGIIDGRVVTESHSLNLRGVGGFQVDTEHAQVDASHNSAPFDVSVTDIDEDTRYRLGDMELAIPRTGAICFFGISTSPYRTEETFEPGKGGPVNLGIVDMDGVMRRENLEIMFCPDTPHDMATRALDNYGIDANGCFDIQNASSANSGVYVVFDTSSRHVERGSRTAVLIRVRIDTQNPRVRWEASTTGSLVKDFDEIAEVARRDVWKVHNRPYQRAGFSYTMAKVEATPYGRPCVSVMRQHTYGITRHSVVRPRDYADRVMRNEGDRNENDNPFMGKNAAQHMAQPRYLYPPRYFVNLVGIRSRSRGPVQAPRPDEMVRWERFDQKNATPNLPDDLCPFDVFKGVWRDGRDTMMVAVMSILRQQGMHQKPVSHTEFGVLSGADIAMLYNEHYRLTVDGNVQEPETWNNAVAPLDFPESITQCGTSLFAPTAQAERGLVLFTRVQQLKHKLVALLQSRQTQHSENLDAQTRVCITSLFEIQDTVNSSIGFHYKITEKALVNEIVRIFLNSHPSEQ